MSKKLFIDTETYSDVDLRTSNVYKYIESPNFAVTLTAWAVDDDPVQVADGVPDEVVKLLKDRNVIKIAHNAAFDRIVLSKYAADSGFLHPRTWYCTMIASRYFGYPGKLGDAVNALGLDSKDTAGTALINKFAKPNKDGSRNQPADFPDEWESFKSYARTDVEVMRQLYNTLPEVDRKTLKEYWLDQRVNDAGLPVDLTLVEAASRQAEEQAAAALAELKELTGLSNPNSVTQLLRFYKENGYKKDSLAKAYLERLAAAESDHILVKASKLRLRTNSASVKKFDAFKRLTSEDARLRGQFRFYGAHTGRWAGTGVQLQNLPSAVAPASEGESPDDSLSRLAESVATGQKVGHLDELKPLIRGSLRSDVGFCVVDFSAIEARVLAWLAGEEWALEAFRAGEDLYVSTAKRMGPQYDRKAGKVATLALGYGGGVKALQAMGGDAIGTEAQQKEVVYAWRAANPNIKNFWNDLERVFTSCGELPFLKVDSEGPGHRRIVLPSGRAMNYRRVSRTADGLQYVGVMKERKKLWGGILTENVVQAAARDLLAEAMTRLDLSGFRVVGHVHDEVLVEAPPERLDEVISIMTESPAWSGELPLNAEGYTCGRYRKE